MTTGENLLRAQLTARENCFAQSTEISRVLARDADASTGAA